jgi:U6 snRNA-associated Sm-like protein LSm7
VTVNKCCSLLIAVGLKGRGASRSGRGAGGIFRGRGNGPSGPQTLPEEKKKREAILDLSKYVNERIRVKFTGGREGMAKFVLPNITLKSMGLEFAVTGILKGYDQLLNLVLDEVQEEVQGT